MLIIDWLEMILIETERVRTAVYFIRKPAGVFTVLVGLFVKNTAACKYFESVTVLGGWPSLGES